MSGLDKNNQIIIYNTEDRKTKSGNSVTEDSSVVQKESKKII